MDIAVREESVEFVVRFLNTAVILPLFFFFLIKNIFLNQYEKSKDKSSYKKNYAKGFLAVQICKSPIYVCMYIYICC